MSDHVQRHEARDALLALLQTMHRDAEHASVARASMVRQARLFGATWDQIGEALNMTRQAAHKRFGSIADTGTTKGETA